VRDGTLIRLGGSVKALGDGRFEAPLITFTDATQPDLVQTFFDARTNYWREFPARVPLLYSHGYDAALRLKPLGMGTAFRGGADLSMTDAGVWMQGQLDLRDEYEAMIYSMIETGKMGTSSGSASHMVEYAEEPDHPDVWRITSWPIVEGSLTPTPAEPKNTVMPVRSVLNWIPNPLKSAGDPAKLFRDVEAIPVPVPTGAKPATLRDFEEQLRGLGWTRAEATTIAKRGFEAFMNASGALLRESDGRSEAERSAVLFPRERFRFEAERRAARIRLGATV